MPKDANQRAKLIGDLATGLAEPEAPEAPEAAEKNPHAVALGRLGGRKGGKARAAKLSKERRSEIARQAARVRWAPRT